MKDKIENVLELIRPRLALHGGNVEFVDFDNENGKVSVRMQGACRGCPLSQITLKAGIEALLMSELPEIKVVEAVE
jgi:Fe-S cluster biogenesis protein NfuA